MKRLRVRKDVKAIKFEEIWAELKSKMNFLGTITLKILKTNSSFHGKQRTTRKV